MIESRSPGSIIVYFFNAKSGVFDESILGSPQGPELALERDRFPRYAKRSKANEFTWVPDASVFPRHIPLVLSI